MLQLLELGGAAARKQWKAAAAKPLAVAAVKELELTGPQTGTDKEP